MPCWALPVAIFALSFACFAPALGGEFLDYDDDRNFTNNGHYRGLSPAHLTWMFTNLDGVYIPLTWLSLAIDYTIWEMRPFGYHLTNTLLHATGAVLLYFLILALLGKDQRSKIEDQSGFPPVLPGGSGGTSFHLSSFISGLSATQVAAAAGALFWAIHPLRAESVAWITERRDVLCGVFFMLAMLAYVRMARAAADAERRKFLCLSIAAYALSLLSKASAMTLPAVLLVLDVCPLRRWQPGARGRLLIEKIPFALLGLAAAWIGARAQLVAGAALSLEQHTISERLLQAAYGLCFYAWKTIVPLSLSPLYLLGHRLHLHEPRFIAALAAVAVVTIAVLALARRRPEPLAAWLGYGLLVSPVLGFFQSGPHLAADRFTYLPSVAWSLLGAAALLRLVTARPHARKEAATAGAIVLAVLGFLTLGQARIWKGSVALWEQAVRVHPDNHTGWHHLGLALLAKGRNADALTAFDKAIGVASRYADPYNARGYAKLQIRDLDGAIADFTGALEREFEPRADAYYNRGTAHRLKGDLRSAAEDFARALEASPPGSPLRARVIKELKDLPPRSP